MHEVAENLLVGAEAACSHGDPSRAVVHACKHPCHQDAVGYTGNPSSSHPEYLVASRDGDLYLNLVDMNKKLKHRYTGPIVDAALDFIDENIEQRPVVVHCNQGRSRSPSLALLYLAKRAGEIPDASYAAAREAFEDRYPGYVPGRGIQRYLETEWNRLE